MNPCEITTVVTRGKRRPQLRRAMLPPSDAPRLEKLLLGEALLNQERGTPYSALLIVRDLFQEAPAQ